MKNIDPNDVALEINAFCIEDHDLVDFTNYKRDADGKPERDSLGRIKYRAVTDKESENRRNYQKGDVINYLDGDSLIAGISYGYGKTTLISDKSRVYKGGSWNDMPYWLSPGTRRYLQEDQSSSTIGFRCAMTHYGAPEGTSVKHNKTGNFFPSRRQKR